MACTAPSISLDVCKGHVAVVRITGQPTAAEWPQYEQQVLRMYNTRGRFVLVYDLRDMGMPSFDIIARQRRLLQRLKPWTCRKMLGVVVLTASESMRDIIAALVRAAGQASPFYTCCSVQELLPIVLRLSAILRGGRGRRAAAVPASMPPRPAWAAVNTAGLAGIVLMLFIRCARHLIALHFDMRRRAGLFADVGTDD
jgi:hypothetical protein